MLSTSIRFSAVQRLPADCTELSATAWFVGLAVFWLRQRILTVQGSLRPLWAESCFLNHERSLAMTKHATEKAVVRAAMQLCAAGKGFCFKDIEHHNQISDPAIGRRLEQACARLTAARKRSGKRG